MSIFGVNMNHRIMQRKAKKSDSLDELSQSCETSQHAAVPLVVIVTLDGCLSGSESSFVFLASHLDSENNC